MLIKGFILWSWKEPLWSSSHIWIFHPYDYSEWISLSTRAIFLKKMPLIYSIYSSFNSSPSGTAHSSSIVCTWNMCLKTAEISLIASSITAGILSQIRTNLGVMNWIWYKNQIWRSLCVCIYVLSSFFFLIESLTFLPILWYGSA